MSSTILTKGFFITGTDTGVGKTTVTALMMKQLQSHGYSVIGCKPIAAGSIQTNKGPRHQDALVYQNINSFELEYSIINPILLQQPTSPNIAANVENSCISVDLVYEAVKDILSVECDFIFFEGIGGWRVPINDYSTMADFARRLNFPVIFIVGIKLGCLNHALLTLEALNNDNMQIAGWIANIIEPETLEIQQNIATLKQFIKAPCLGEIAFRNPDNRENDRLDLRSIMFCKENSEIVQT